MHAFASFFFFLIVGRYYNDPNKEFDIWLTTWLTSYPCKHILFKLV